MLMVQVSELMKTTSKIFYVHLSVLYNTETLKIKQMGTRLKSASLPESFERHLKQ